MTDTPDTADPDPGRASIGTGDLHEGPDARRRAIHRRRSRDHRRPGPRGPAASNASTRSPAADPQARLAALRELLGELGEDAWIRPPFYCDYGWQIRIGPRSFVNYNAVFLDVAPITIGADVQIGPNVQLLTPTHPVEPGAAPGQVGGRQADHHR